MSYKSYLFFKSGLVVFLYSLIIGISRAESAAYWHWLPANNLASSGPPDSIEAPVLASNNEGVLTAIWVERHLSPTSTTYTSKLRVARYQEGRWLETEHLPVPCVSTSPAVALDETGITTVIWSCSTVANGSVIYSRRYLNGKWSSISTITEGPSLYNLNLSVDDQGRPVAVWYLAEELSGGKKRVKLQAARFNQDQWETPLVLSESSNSMSDPEPPVLSTNSRGQITVGWIVDRGGVRNAEIITYGDGVWGQVLQLPTSLGSRNLSLALENSGNLMVIAENKDVNSTWMINSMRLLKGVAGEIVALNQKPSNNPVDPVISGDGAGHYTVAWTQSSEKGQTINAIRFNGLEWGSPVPVFSQPFEYTGPMVSGISLDKPSLVTDQFGAVTVAWGGTSSSCSPGGCWTSPSDIQTIRLVGDTWGNVINIGHLGRISNIVVDLFGSISIGSFGRSWDSYGMTTRMNIAVVRGEKKETPPESRQFDIQVDGYGLVSDSYGEINCSSSCAHEVDKGSVLDLRAVPSSGHEFSGWEGACSGLTNCRIVLDENKKLSAKFTEKLPENRQIDIKIDGSGKVINNMQGIDCSSSCIRAINKGTIIDLTARASKGHIFAGWGGACSGLNTCRVVLDDDVKVTAQFKDLNTQGLLSIDVQGPNDLLTVTSVPPGITCKPGGVGDCRAYFDKRSTVKLIAGMVLPPYLFNPPSYRFKGWRGACFGRKEECILKIRNKTKVKAFFH